MKNYYLYTETAFHHEGDIDYLYQLIDETYRIKADGIKFQILTNIDDFISSYNSSYTVLSKYVLDIEQWRNILEYTKAKGIDIIAMPLNQEACDLISDFPVKYLDIHSVSFNDWELLNRINNSDADIILGVGGRTLTEINQLVGFFKGKVKVLMAGFQSFPSKIETIQLGKIQKLKAAFPSLKIGYADHSAPEDMWQLKSNEYARLLGATVFEKHITIEHDIKRVDSASACTGKDIAKVIASLDFIDEYVLNDTGLEFLNEFENKYKARELVCCASRDIEIGETISKSDIKMKMIDHPNVISDIGQLVGSITERSYKKDEPFEKRN